MQTLKAYGCLAFAVLPLVACEGFDTTGPQSAAGADLRADALPAATCQNVRGTGQATAGIGGILTGDLNGTFDVPTNVQTDAKGRGLFLQTQFTSFSTNLGEFTTEDFFVFGPLPAPGESTARFNGRLEVVGEDDVVAGFLHFNGTIEFTIILVGQQPVVTLVADFKYSGRICPV